MLEQFRLDGRVALITGGASGLGAQMARVFAQAGARIVVADLARQAERAAQVQADCRGFGAESEFVAADVTSVASLDAMAAAAVRRFGTLDLLVNSAGTTVRKPSLETSEADWDLVLDVNLKGTFFASVAAARVMKDHGGGAIVNLASIFGLIGGGGRPGYCASKGGVVNLTRALAGEWAPYRIRVNAIAPTFVVTPLNEEVLTDPAVKAALIAQTPLQTYGTPDDMAYAALYLCSPAAQHVTGVTLPVDAGWTAQ